MTKRAIEKLKLDLDQIGEAVSRLEGRLERAEEDRVVREERRAMFLASRIADGDISFYTWHQQSKHGFESTETPEEYVKTVSKNHPSDRRRLSEICTVEGFSEQQILFDAIRRHTSEMDRSAPTPLSTEEAKRNIEGMRKQIEYNGPESVDQFFLEQACLHLATWLVYDIYKESVEMKESGEID